MKERTDWEKAAVVEGKTESERVLIRLGKKAFLSLWSYPNVFTDEGRGDGKGDGKELCDLLVVFGNNVLLFSDKECEFHGNTDVKVAWRRWYRRAIEKSARQLAGAERFAKSFPKRIYLNKDCRTPLPIALPNQEVAKYYLIAVTRGSHLAAREFFGSSSSGSLILDSSLAGPDHYEAPFRIGHPLRGRFVHVLDEMTVDLLLEELDTIPDLVSYLDCKEAFLQKSRATLSVAGEEELLARYMTTVREGKHGLPDIPRGAAFVVLPEGGWNVYSNSEQRAAKLKADEGSYMWDAIIEQQSAFIRAGTATTVPWQPTKLLDHERIVRALAEQNRVSRRALAADLRYALSVNQPGRMFSRVHMIGSPPGRAFFFLTVPKPTDIDYERYRRDRQFALTVYCHGIKDAMPTLREAIGIASEPFSEEVASQDFIYVDLASEMDPKEKKYWRDAADELGILRPKTELKLLREGPPEFPLPFNFEEVDRFTSLDGMPMNRAARRRMASEARRKKKAR